MDSGRPAEVEIPPKTRRITFRLAKVNPSRVTGQVYEGSKDKPVTHAGVDMIRQEHQVIAGAVTTRASQPFESTCERTQPAVSGRSVGEANA